MSTTATDSVAQARANLDAWVRELMQWHFDPATGCPFWLDFAQRAGWDPRREVHSYEDLAKFGFFEDEWLRGGPVRRWVPRGYAGRPVYTFETGGSTGVPKSRINVDDFRIDYEMFSKTLPDDAFPPGADWLSVGPSGPRRLRLAVEHLAQHRGGICFMVDLDPRWVIKLVKSGDIQAVEAYKRHVIDQALTLLKAHEIQCLFTTPKLLEALCERVSLKKVGIRGIFCGGTEMTPQFHRFAVEELLDGVYFAPTYGNTLMGLATHKPPTPEDDWAIIYYPPAPRAMIEVVDPDKPDTLVGFGETGRVRLTTLTKEFFMPRFLERDEAEREAPCDQYPWDGVRNVRPFSRFKAAVVEGVYLMLHLPLLRHGRPYRSVDRVLVPHHRTREPFVEISQANTGLIRKDLAQQAQARRALASRSAASLIELSARAADAFLHATLPLDPLAGTTQTPDDYIAQLSATTGLPHVMGRRNMQKIAGVLANVQSVLAGLTRGIDLGILDRGIGEVDGRMVSFFPRGDSLGIVLPSNSPGVHSLWAPSIALKTPLVLKPGSAEPWSPFRIAQAFLHVGCPPEAFCFYPADHAGGGEILRSCGRGMVFGDTASVSRWANDARIEKHGPGYSKVVLDAEASRNWEKYLDVMVTSIVENGGRSCINASGVWVTSHADEIAEALAARLASVQPRPAEDPGAQIAPFVDPQVAHRISAMIDQGLREPGATDVSARHRPGSRIAELDGCTYLVPTIVRAEESHTLANREFLFPFASVVQVPEDEMPAAFGPTLVVTAITSNEALIDRLLTCPAVDRLNIGPLPTNQIVWDQPHEGNLFEHLYGRRSIQQTA